MALASILVKLGLDASGFQTGLKRSESAAIQFGTAVQSRLKGYLAGLFSVGMVTAYTKSVIEWADKMQDLSEDFKISTEVLQQWEHAALGTRATVDDFIKSFTFLAKQNKDLNNAEVLTLFNKLAEQFKRGEMSLGQLTEKLGKGAAVLVGPFSNGLQESADELRKMNQLLTGDQVLAISKVADA